MEIVLYLIGAILGAVLIIVIAWKLFAGVKRRRKNYERSLKMVPMMIHLPPRTDDIEVGGRDERDVSNEEISQAQVMYNIISSTLTKGLKGVLYGQKHISFEIVAHDGVIHYYAVVPAVLTETMKQAITAAYPTARLEEVHDPNFFSRNGGIDAVVGGELELKDDYWYPLATYEDSKRDASLALINALSVAKKGDGIGIQIMFRPCDPKWTSKSLQRVKNLRDGKKSRRHGVGGNIIGRFVEGVAETAGDVAQALWKPPEVHEHENPEEKILTNLEQEEIQKVEEKTKYPGFQTLIRFIASSDSATRSTALIGGVVSVFSQFDLPNYNGFRYNQIKRSKDLATDYILRNFPQENNKFILNSVEMASIFHLPSQNSIPTSQVERQSTKQVDGPAQPVEEGTLLGINEFRGEKKEIRLTVKDRRRHTYVIGATGMGKSILLTNIAYQDMCDGKGFAFIDPHGDAAELLLSKVPPERMDDIIYFEPGNVEQPVGMNMFEFRDEEQKDFIVQESLNMMISLYDPGNQGIFGPRAQHMFRNAALLLMSDPEGGTFIDIPRCFTDPEFVKSKLKYVTDKTVYDYWTKEFPASQKSNDAGEVTSWFVSKWGPFLSNKMMRNILGQTKSGFNIREIMDNKKILLINLSKGKTGELNAKLLGMIFVMKFQAAAMSRADTPEDEREDFCLFVDEFQNFSTESFESILSEARKYRLNLVLANQFMTQLTDKIREAILGNVGTIMSGRLGVTDAELMEKAFSPIFNAEDLHAMANYSAIATVMMNGMPTSPFTMKLLPPMGDSSDELMERMKEYASSKYGRPREDVEREIDARLMDTSEAAPKQEAPQESVASAMASLDGGNGAGAMADAPMSEMPSAPIDIPKPTPKPAAKPAAPKKNFLDSWLERKAQTDEKKKEEARAAVKEKQSKAADAPVKEKPAKSSSDKKPTTPKKEPAKIETKKFYKEATIEELPTAPAIKIKKSSNADSALDGLVINTGSVWAQKAAENVKNASVEEAKIIPDAEPADPTSLKIEHSPMVHGRSGRPTFAMPQSGSGERMVATGSGGQLAADKLKQAKSSGAASNGVAPTAAAANLPKPTSLTGLGSHTKNLVQPTSKAGEVEPATVAVTTPVPTMVPQKTDKPITPHVTEAIMSNEPATEPATMVSPAQQATSQTATLQIPRTPVSTLVAQAPQTAQAPQAIQVPQVTQVPQAVAAQVPVRQPAQAAQLAQVAQAPQSAQVAQPIRVTQPVQRVQAVAQPVAQPMPQMVAQAGVQPVRVATPVTQPVQPVMQAVAPSQAVPTVQPAGGAVRVAQQPVAQPVQMAQAPQVAQVAQAPQPMTQQIQGGGTVVHHEEQGVTLKWR